MCPGHPEVVSGRSSSYQPNDGHNAGTLSCGGTYDWDQKHIAYRDWRRMGCGAQVVVYSHETRRWALTRVWDSGPWGAYRGKLRRCKQEGRWRLWTKTVKPPRGWRWRGVVDLSAGLHRDLGRPSFLSRTTLVLFPSKGFLSLLLESLSSMVLDVTAERVNHPQLWGALGKAFQRLNM